MNSKLIKRVKDVFVNLLTALVIVFAMIISIISITTTKDGIPNVFGYSPFTLQSNSMYPILKKGDLIISKKYDGKEIKVNDIISFKARLNSEDYINTHRVVDVTLDEGVYLYKTKGDNNDEEDSELITDTDILAIYDNIKIPLAGYLVDFLKSKYGFLIFVIIPLVIIFITQVKDFYIMLLDYKLREIE